MLSFWAARSQSERMDAGKRTDAGARAPVRLRSSPIKLGLARRMPGRVEVNGAGPVRAPAFGRGEAFGPAQARRGKREAHRTRRRARGGLGVGSDSRAGETLGAWR